MIRRALKEFATKEQLPFEQFGMNRAYYYFLVVAHFLYEAYTLNVGGDLIAVTCYPNTFRHRLIDFAVKVVKTSGQFIPKVVERAFEELQIARLWLRTSEPQPIGIT